MSVLLPDPFSPTMACTVPLRTVRLTPLLAMTPGNLFTMSRSSMTVVAVWTELDMDECLAHPRTPRGHRPTAAQKQQCRPAEPGGIADSRRSRAAEKWIRRLLKEP